MSRKGGGDLQDQVGSWEDRGHPGFSLPHRREGRGLALQLRGLAWPAPSWEGQGGGCTGTLTGTYQFRS